MKALLLGLTALAISPAYSQDSTYFARLKNGQTVFSSTLRLRTTPAAEKYLALDQNRTIPIGEVERFHSRLGLFVTVPGSTGTDIYRVDREGPKISLFSQVVYDPDAATPDGNGSYSRKEFFRKDGDVLMHPVTYSSLMNALSDNPDSQHQLHVAKAKVYTGLSLLLVSAVIEGIGIYHTARRTAPHLDATTGAISSSHTVSPLLYVGLGGMAGGVVLILGAKHNEFRALDVYNGGNP